MTDLANASGPVIVVGIDGSDASKDALRWAAHQAQLAGASLRAVMTRDIPMSRDIPTFAYGRPLPFPADMDLEGGSRTALDQVIVDVLGDKPAVEVSAVVIEGRPAEELLKAAQTAELLVVGSRGHGAFAGMVLGSVSEHCVAHSPCPVVVVRHSSPPA